MIITATELRSKGACDIEEFEARWPDGCEVTPENCRIAFSEAKLNPEWAAENLLPATALAKYKKVVTPAFDRYEHATVPAMAEYKKIADVAWDTVMAEYKKATAAAGAEYREATAAAWAEYMKIAAAEFCRLANRGNST